MILNSINYVGQKSLIQADKIRKTIDLLEGGATIPFIARYRKEQTGSLDEEDIFKIKKYHEEYLEFIHRRDYILKTLEDTGILTDELKKKILACFEIAQLEDLYAPYKQKKQSKADLARQNGLEPLALKLMSDQKFNLEIEAEKLICKAFDNVDSVLEACRHIVADFIHKDEALRSQLRNVFMKSAVLVCKLVKGKEAEAVKFKDYWNFQENFYKIPAHRYLAICRAENEKLLRVSFNIDQDSFIYFIQKKYQWRHPKQQARQIEITIDDVLDRLILPLIIAQQRQELKEKADQKSIEIFGKNLRQALLEAPLGQQAILAIDPGFRTGCKCACIDSSGSLLEYFTIFPVEPQNNKKESKEIIDRCIKKHSITHFAIGDGTAGKEVKEWMESMSWDSDIKVFSVDESGASVYSASSLAREEFPNLDIVYRGAISIGRRLQDPLAELIKIDPKSIGFGQYQHDVNQKWLQERLDYEVSSCVNSIGVQLNTASATLLSYISGIGPTLAQSIVKYRNENGPFATKSELLKVSRLGAKVFEQCAGFVRIRAGKHSLDNTAVHPERYILVESIAKSIGHTVKELVETPEITTKIQLQNFVSEQCQIETLQDILLEIKRPGIDPRGLLQSFSFDQSIKSISDLQIGMWIPGMVKNIVQFGVFVDLGLKESGLIHVSELSHEFVKDPSQVVALRQKLLVRVIGLDISQKKIQLSLKNEFKE
ncbi:MAG: helix-hairpin-helix domain-containing protein [Saprospiraceae bacterium]|nr:helix-hairpin-helix domain-containing protein [Saprospiraceae bacterium]